MMGTVILKTAGGGKIVLVTAGEGASIHSSGIKEKCPYCGEEECFLSCDESKAGGFGAKPHPEAEDALIFNAGVRGIESLLLAMAGTGRSLSDIEGPVSVALEDLANGT